MKASDWISVKDKLPKIGEYVLVCKEFEGEMWISLAAYLGCVEYAHWHDQQGFDIHDVTHWQKIVLPKKK